MLKNSFQVVCIVACMFPLVGFGLCGLVGIGNMINARNSTDLITIGAFTVLGFAISFGCARLVLKYVKEIRASRSDSEPPAT